ncbi:MAG TPA: hypothetical protein VGR03_00425 [Candidatus Acidoferrum sp.]|nr:hypothetical protein [Candidatus Acidoferrum sp.]
MRRPFLQVLMCVALTAEVLICGLSAQAQVTKGCSEINYVGADSSNPFTAEYVTTSTMPTPAGVPKTMVLRENVARDSQGRIRFEKHGVAQPPDDRKTVTLETPDGKPFTVTREEYGTLIDIFDCASGTFVRIQPGMRIVTVKEGKSEAPARRAKHAYSTPYFPSPGSKTLPNVIQEELGTRDIQGIPARGLKTTTLGTEKDADWNGKPIRETELWVSDDLAAQLLRIDKDLRTGNEGRSELLAIKREEPDPALFEIPKDCEVNPAMLPSQKGLGVVRPAGQ